MSRKTDQKGFSVVEIMLVVLVIGLIAFIAWLVLSRQSTSTNTTNQSNNTQSTGVEIPELGVKIADPENRGVKVFYDDTGKTNCLTNENYYANNGCANYLGSTHCEDQIVTDGATCPYYIYDNTTYTPNTITSTNAASFAKYYQCDSDLVIYETNPANDDAQTDLTATVEINDKAIALWAHGSSIDSTCSTTEATNADAYIKDLLKYVKANVSAL